MARRRLIFVGAPGDGGGDPGGGGPGDIPGEEALATGIRYYVTFNATIPSFDPPTANHATAAAPEPDEPRRSLSGANGNLTYSGSISTRVVYGAGRTTFIAQSGPNATAATVAAGQITTGADDGATINYVEFWLFDPPNTLVARV